jgi:hypothetical protein
MKRAIELSKKTIPIEIEICLLSALIIGEIAEMALPPQIAVPQEISWEIFLSIPKYFPIRRPKVIVVVIEATVNKKLSSPALKALNIFIPKPSPTTDIFNNQFTALPLISINGFPMIWAVTNPRAKAMEDETQGKRQTEASAINKILMIENDLPKI